MPLRIALAGLGSAATRAHLPALLQLASEECLSLVGVCDPVSAQRRRFAQQLPDVPGFGDVAEMIDAVRPNMLVVATPPSAHLGAVRVALSAGVHVICEKPLGLTAAEAEALAALRSRHPRVGLVSVHQYEYAPAWRVLSRVAAGATRRGETWELVARVERPGTDPLSAGSWRAKTEDEGGILGDHAVHYLSMLWKLDPSIRVISHERDGEGGLERARLELEGAAGRASVDVSYAGGRRHNSIRVCRPRCGLEAAWEDGGLTISRSGRPGVRHAVAGLSDREFVNSLYVPFYTEVLAGIPDPAWRAQRWSESISVARMLGITLDSVRRPQEVGTSWLDDLRALARAALLAFADLGIYLTSDRDRLIRKMRGLDLLNPAQLDQFVDLCIEAELITPGDAGRLRLSPIEAKRLARSFDFGGPVPDDQADAWALHLAGTATA